MRAWADELACKSSCTSPALFTTGVKGAIRLRNQFAPRPVPTTPNQLSPLSPLCSCLLVSLTNNNQRARTVRLYGLVRVTCTRLNIQTHNIRARTGSRELRIDQADAPTSDVRVINVRPDNAVCAIFYLSFSELAGVQFAPSL
jgi:hypothetical protein